MTSVKVLECCEPWFSLIKIGRKPVEGRRNSRLWASIVAGEVVRFDNATKGSAGYECFYARVTDVRRYPPPLPSALPTGSASSSSLPTLPVVAETKTAETKVVETTIVGAVSVGTKTAETKTAETKTAETKIVDTMSSDGAQKAPDGDDPLTAYLLTETLARALPGVATLEEARKIYLDFWSMEQINTVGMLALEVRPLSGDEAFLALASLRGAVVTESRK